MEIENFQARSVAQDRTLKISSTDTEIQNQPGTSKKVTPSLDLYVIRMVATLQSASKIDAFTCILLKYDL